MFALNVNPQSYSVLLDPGHGGTDGGAPGACGTPEKTLNLDYSNNAFNKINANNYGLNWRAYRTRNSDIARTPEYRYIMANNTSGLEADADNNRIPSGGVKLFLSIHCNSGGSASGTEVLWPDGNEPVSGDRRYRSRVVAIALLTYHLNITNSILSSVSRGIKRPQDIPTSVGVLSNTIMPAVLIETDFLSNNARCTTMVTQSYKDAVGDAIKSTVKFINPTYTNYVWREVTSNITSTTNWTNEVLIRNTTGINGGSTKYYYVEGSGTTLTVIHSSTVVVHDKVNFTTRNGGTIIKDYRAQIILGKDASFSPFTTGIGDGIWIDGSSTIWQNGSFTFSGTYYDAPPPNPINRFDWKLKVFHGEGNYVWANGTTPPYPTYPWSIALGNLPNGYCWVRDENNNVIGRVEVTGIDEYENIQATGYKDIVVIDVSSNTISGSLTHDETWCGNMNIVGNVTVPSGITLKILPGSTINFLNNSSLIISGNLNCPSSPDFQTLFDFISQNSSTQNGIKVNPGGSINISNSILKNAYRGIYINEALGAIDNCEFYNCYSGIHLYRTNYTIDDPYITNNFSHDNQFGVVMYYSSPYLTGNEFSNNWRGVGCADYSSPYLGYAGDFGNNYIHNNNVGVFAYGYSNPFLGRSTCTIQGGNNRIENNYYKELYTHTYCTILAENNWWGNSPPNSSQFYVSSNSSLDYDPWLTSAPQFRQSPNGEKSPEEQLFNKNLAVLNDENIYSDEGLIILRDSEKEIVTSFNPDWPIFWKLLYARNLIDVKKYKFAQKICKDIITTYPDSAYSYYALDLLWRASRKFDKDSLILFLSEISNIKTKKSLFGAAELILAGYDKNNRIKNLDKMIKKYKGEPIIEFVLFQKFLYYYYEENNMEQARLVAEELTRMFPDSESTLDAFRHLGENNIQLGKTLSSQESNAINGYSNKPLKYKLLGHYPNPFNPLTTISYALPYDSKVEIVIYDLLGKKIKHFFWDSQTSGYHNTIWDGKNENGSQVSSGIYIYRIKAISLESKSATFEASSKLILTK